MRITRKKLSCRYQPPPCAPQTICYDSFYSRSGLPYLFMNLPAPYYIARGTLESIVVTYNCTNTLYPDGNI